MAQITPHLVNSNSQLVTTNWIVSSMQTLTTGPNAEVLFSKFLGGQGSIINNATVPMSTRRSVYKLRGELTGFALRDKETAKGTGESTALYSMPISIMRYRKVEALGDEFDARLIGDMRATSTNMSAMNLLKWFHRTREQQFIDALSGLSTYTQLNPNDDVLTRTQFPTHRFIYPFASGVSTFGYDALEDMSAKLQENTGYDEGDRRAFLKPVSMRGNVGIYFLMVTPAVFKAIRADAETREIMMNAGMRGEMNPLLAGNDKFIVIGNIMVLNSGFFQGRNRPDRPAGAGWGLNDISVEACGLRVYQHATADNTNPSANNLVNTTNVAWSGQTNFSYTTGSERPTYARCLLLGRNALVYSRGAVPMFKTEADDFELTKEVAMIYYHDLQKINYNPARNDADYDYGDLPFANNDIGVIAVDVQVK